MQGEANLEGGPGVQVLGEHGAEIEVVQDHSVEAGGPVLRDNFVHSDMLTLVGRS